MNRLRLFAPLLVLPVAVLAGGSQRPETSPQQIRLCDALESVRDGQALPVIVSGIYAVGYEHQVFYDPAEPECSTDIQPATWVEFAPGTEVPPALRTLLAQSGRAFVTFRAELLGPGIVGPDDRSLPLYAAFANRVGARRYGHFQGFRTKLLVSEVVAARAVPSGTALRGLGDWAPASPAVDLEVQHAEVPRYPGLARRAGISGTVVIGFTIVEGGVRTAVVKSGDRMLAEAAVANVMTWRFEPGTNGAFTTTFFYDLERRKSGSDRRPIVELHLPEYVRITASRWDW